MTPNVLPLIDAAQVGELLGIPESTVMQLSREERIPSVIIGRRVKFSEPMINELVAERLADADPGHRRV